MKPSNVLYLSLITAINLCSNCSEKSQSEPSLPNSSQEITREGEDSTKDNRQKSNTMRQIEIVTNQPPPTPVVPTATPNITPLDSQSPPNRPVKGKVIAWSGDQSKFDDVKIKIKALPNIPSAGKVSTAKQFIEAGAAGNWTNWMNNPGLTLNQADKVVLVNASNSGISFGGSTINGAITSFVTNVYGQTSWHNLELPNGTKNPTTIKPGEYAISNAGNWRIYHACGVSAGDIGKGRIESIEKAQEIMAIMIFNMLTKAHSMGTKTIVLCAISTVAFAGAGTNADGSSFTQDQFLKAMYIGMYNGIENFKKANPASCLSIILNSWDIDVVK